MNIDVGSFRRPFLGAAVLALSVPAFSQAGGPSVLQRIEPGQWELRDTDNEAILRASICIGDPFLLTQPRHGSAACNRTIISSSPRTTVVHYTCPAAGFGRTTISYETPRLVQVDSQGIYRNAPFGFRVEARKVGPCRTGDASGR